ASRETRARTRRCASIWRRASRRSSRRGNWERAESTASYTVEGPESTAAPGVPPMLALLIAALCPPQQLPAARFTAGEALQYRLDALGADVGAFEVRAEAPPAAERSRAIALLSSRAKTSAFVSTNLGRYETYATALVGSDFLPLRYREDVDENDVHRGTELTFAPQGGPPAVKATRNGEPEPM